uniref:Secreted protein n=1 Tax=Anopheles quadriannulatus TaxID=34691 RepID=A0A182XTJ3_ANOQN
MGRNVLKMLVAFCFHFVSFSFFPPFSYQTYGVMYTSASDIRGRERRQKLDWSMDRGWNACLHGRATSGRVEREGTRFLM